MDLQLANQLFRKIVLIQTHINVAGMLILPHWGIEALAMNKEIRTCISNQKLKRDVLGGNLKENNEN